MSAFVLDREPTWRERHRAFVGAVALWTAAIGAGLLAVVVGMFGMKGIVVAVAGLAFLAVLLVVTKREEVILATAVLSLFALFRKSFGTQHLDVSGGPISVYVSSFDVMVFLLWVTWWLRGPREMAQQLRRAFRRSVMWAPIAGFALILPSVLTAESTGLALAEVVRMATAIAIFVYFAVRVRTKTHVWIVLGALGAGLGLEALVVAGQYLTRSALGMSAFGTPAELNNRFDGYDALRPFGTILHPVFLGAFVGPCALMAYSLAANLRRPVLRLASLGVAGIGVTPILLANARTAALGVAAAFVVLTVVFMVGGRLTAPVVKGALAGAAVLVVLTFPLLSSFVARSFDTRSGGRSTRTATCTRASDAATTCSSHFSFEWRARMELNRVGIRLWEQEPVLGRGLNNFEQVMGPYDTHGLIFGDAPVHNLYLLQLAESGVVGLAGLFVVALPLFLISARLARSRDRLLSAVGFGVVGAFVFWAVEEVFEFSLRQEQPRALFFMFAGLAVACARLAGLDRPAAVLRARPLPLPPLEGGERAGAAARAGARRTAAPGKTRRRNRRPARAARAAAPELRTRAGRLARRRWRRQRATAMTITSLVVMGGTMTFAGGAPASADPSLEGAKIVFAATDHATKRRAIYTVDPDGSNLRKVSPDDAGDYSWPTWAYGGRKIVFTARVSGQIEPVFLMDADGSNIRQVTNNPWRNAQPQVAPDGRSMIFTSFWDEYQKVAIYRMDLVTGAVTNLSLVDSQRGAFDSDPELTADGRRIFFIDAREPGGGANRPGQVAVMNVDGTGRRLVTDDGFYNTDPSTSPDGTHVAIARYIGEGEPRDPNSDNPFQTKLYDFVLVNRDVETGVEQQLTAGAECYRRPESNACAPEEGPAYVPQWTPDGSAIGYLSVLSSRRTCICLVDRDGTRPRVVFSSTDVAINWFHWVVPSEPASGAILDPRPQSELTDVRMVVTGTARDGRPVVLLTTPDRFGGQVLPVPPALAAESARLTPDRDAVWFDGNALFDPDAVEYSPAPPSGVGRTRHYTLGWMRQYYVDPPIARVVSATRQLWSLRLALPPSLVQRTDVGIEDYRDAIPDGEVRGNIQPSVSPDGRYVLFTNVSSVNTESFILRYDRASGEVLSLTNATAGALAVSDAQAAWSPDSKRVAFTSNGLDGMQIWIMDADGNRARKLTDDDYVNAMPSWSPDGRFVVYSSYRGDELISTGTDDISTAAARERIDLEHWVLVRVDVRTGEQTVLVGEDQSPMFKPVYDPDGSKIYYIGISGPPLQPDVYVVDAGGGAGRPLQVTLETFETGIDIR
jgi:Tol biopolymer transport system component